MEKHSQSGQLAHIGEGIVAEEADLIVAQVSAKQKHSAGSNITFNSIFLSSSLFSSKNLQSFAIAVPVYIYILINPL